MIAEFAKIYFYTKNYLFMINRKLFANVYNVRNFHDVVSSANCILEEYLVVLVLEISYLNMVTELKTIKIHFAMILRGF